MLKRIPIYWKLSASYIIVILLVLLALSYVRNLVTSRDLITILAVLIIIILSCGFAWYFVNHFIKRPINRLVHGMNRLAEKRFDFRLKEDSKDEFGSMAVSFNDMASMLYSSVAELQKTRDYLSGILESSADIIITVNPSGIIRTFNTGAEMVLGYQRDEVVGQRIEMLFADPRERTAAIKELDYKDSVVNYETRFLTKSGQVRTVLLTLSRLRNATGAIIGTIGISKDITELKRLQEQLMQSERFIAIGQVFTGIQHSMKNMLNACKGGAYMVKTGLAKDNRKMLEEGWEIVQQGISRMTDMSTDMLKYVKEWKPKFNCVDLAPTLSEIYRIVKQTAKDKGIELHLEISSPLPQVLCDARMIHSAAMDIVSNAVDACLWKDYEEDETPEVVFGAYLSDDGQELIIEVKDNGCGMTEDIKANIFAPFFSTKSKAGTGLGLAITSRMIEVHDGTIDVESEPNRGTVFRIRLPLDKTRKSKEDLDAQKSSGG